MPLSSPGQIARRIFLNAKVDVLSLAHQDERRVNGTLQRQTSNLPALERMYTYEVTSAVCHALLRSLGRSTVDLIDIIAMPSNPQVRDEVFGAYESEINLRRVQERLSVTALLKAAYEDADFPSLEKQLRVALYDIFQKEIQQAIDSAHESRSTRTSRAA